MALISCQHVLNNNLFCIGNGQTVVSLNHFVYNCTCMLLEVPDPLRLKDQEVLLDKAASKDIYGEMRSKYKTTPTAQAKYTKQYSSGCLEWKEIYNLPFKVLNDTK